MYMCIRTAPGLDWAVEFVSQYTVDIRVISIPASFVYLMPAVAHQGIWCVNLKLPGAVRKRRQQTMKTV